MYDLNYYYQQPMYYHYQQQQDMQNPQGNPPNFVQPEEQQYEAPVEGEPLHQVPMEHQQREPVDGGNEAQPSLPITVVPFSDHDPEENILMPIERLVLVSNK